MKTIYKNRLPHIAPVGASFFITFRLADALPTSLVISMKQELELIKENLKREFPADWKMHLLAEQKGMFGKYEHQLENEPFGECLLKNTTAANITVEKLRAYDGQYYDLWAFCIMPNHVHVLLDFSRQVTDVQQMLLSDVPEAYKQLCHVMMLIKGGTARAINLALDRKGSVWAKDSYDHYVRDEAEWHRIVHYILHNPVKARLVQFWKEYPYTFMRS